MLPFVSFFPSPKLHASLCFILSFSQAPCFPLFHSFLRPFPPPLHSLLELLSQPLFLIQTLFPHPFSPLPPPLYPSQLLKSQAVLQQIMFYWWAVGYVPGAKGAARQARSRLDAFLLFVVLAFQHFYFSSTGRYLKGSYGRWVESNPSDANYQT